MSEQSYRYQMLLSAQSLYRMSGLQARLKGLVNCCSRYNPAVNGFFLSLSGGDLVVRGRGHCHNRASCPVCSYPRQRGMMSDICHGIWNARHQGYGVYLVTLTFSHGVGDDLGAIQYMMSEARQRMYRHGGFRGGMLDMGYIGRVTDYEVQLMGVNGAHPHTHELFFGSAGLFLSDLEELYNKYWLTALYESGLSARVGVAVKVTGYKGVGDYITKMGSEVCLQNFSKQSWGGGSLAPLQVLSRYTDTADDRYADAWLDYVMHIRGKRIIGFSRGLRERLDMRAFADVDEVDDTCNADVLQVSLDDSRKLSMCEWYDLCDQMINGQLDDVLSYLKSIHISYEIYGGGLNRLRDIIYCRDVGDVEGLERLVKSVTKGC